MVANVDAAPGANGGSTSAIDTTGANLLVVGIASWGSFTAGTEAVTDSKSNTFTGLTASVGTVAVRIFYCANPTVGSSHTVTYSDSNSYPAINFAAFSGAATTSPADVQSGANNASATSLASGSVTPTVDGCVMVSIFGHDNTITGLTQPSGYTTIDTQAYGGSNNFGSGSAYKVQTTASAENPSWSWTTSRPAATCVAAFKPAAGGGGGSSGAASHYYRQQSSVRKRDYEKFYASIGLGDSLNLALAP